MQKTFLLSFAAVLASVCAFGADGTVLVNQSTATAQGGFPYKIMQPGSYRLSGNLTVPLGVDGIDILADNVTLDLNGFSVIGPNFFPNAGIGIFGDDHIHIHILNGAISGFSHGIQLGGSAKSMLIDNIIVDSLVKNAQNQNVLGVSMFVGKNVSSGAVIHNVTVNGQIQIACPGVVTNVVTGNGVVETNIPPDGGGVGFPKNCVGNNVVIAP